MNDALLLHQVLLKTASIYPHNLALVDVHSALTYADVADRVQRMAARLIQEGRAPGVLTAIATTNGPERFLAMYAQMLAGNPFLPIDLSYPQERLLHMLDEANVRVVWVGDGAMDLDLPDRVERLPLETSPASSDAPAAIAAQAEDCAYIIYTSGSTGKPKGVEVSHGAVATMVAGMANVFGLKPEDRMLQFSSPGFDASILEIGVAIASGAALVFSDRRMLTPGEDMARFMEEMGVTATLLPPSSLAAMPQPVGALDPLPSLHILICGGEALPNSLARRWCRGGRRVFNAYGPTEAAICAAAGEVEMAQLETGSAPGIGQPLPGVSLFVVDHRLDPVAPGEIGELMIGGLGVARGYINRPDLTAERFVTLPDGMRVYRTGDLVQLDEDGKIVFCGRIDDQLKLDGFRIEPNEVAERLRQHRNVVDAHVGALDNRLVAWVCGHVVHPTELRAWCATTLPKHMVPSAFVQMEAFPRTTAGKIDRNSLPAPVRADFGAMNAGTVKTGTEEAIAGLFRELLKLDDISTDDSFFDLGGTSLLIGRLAARIRLQLGVEISLGSLFKAPTVHAIADMIDTGRYLRSAAFPPVPPPLVAGPRGLPAPLSFPQRRAWFLDQLIGDALAYQMQASLILRGALDVDVLRATLSTLIERHEILRTRFRDGKDGPIQEAVPAFQADLPIVDLSDLPEDQHAAEVENLIAIEVRRRIRIDEAPLIRWTLYKLSPDEHVLLHIEHHLIHDGWSFAVLLRELVALYEAHLEGRAASIPEPEFQFSDFARWQEKWLQGDVLERFVAHWREQLDDTPPALFLPTDRPRPPSFSFRGDAVSVIFDDEEYEILRRGARRLGVTLYSLMLACFSSLMGRYAGQTDFVVGAGYANRRLAETENIVGMAINALPLRMNLADTPNLETLARRVQETAWDGFTWGDVPLDHLVQSLAPQRDAAHNPLFSVLFSFHDAQVPLLNFGGLTGEIKVCHNGSAKFDINIIVVPEREQRAGTTEIEGCLTLIWEYATDLFDRATAEHMVADYRALLKAAINAPGQVLDILPLSAAEAALVPPDPERVAYRNGFRIDLTEVESVLLSHLQVADATVGSMPEMLDREKVPLIAHVVMCDGAVATPEDILEAARDRLAAIAVPSHIVKMEQLARDAQGRVIRDQLPLPDINASKRELGDTEKRVVRLMADILRRTDVERESDFFALGGRSLMAVQLLARVEKEFGISVPLVNFLRAPNVKTLSSEIDRGGVMRRRITPSVRRLAMRV